MTERLAQAFRRGAPAFIPYVTAGDPDLATTKEIVKALERAGAGVIELGVPFSDPIADGPTNQRAAERALASGTTLRGILELVRELRDEGVATPIILFSYLNPLYALGDGLGEQLRRAGVDGVLAVDLPAEEASELDQELEAAGLARIPLAAPSTSDERLRRMGERGRGFLYYICRYGVTGTRSGLPEDLAAAVARLRAATGLPIAVGFGISTPDHARAVGAVADGVVVGSAIVNIIERLGRDAASEVESFARSLVRAAASGRKGSDPAG